VVAVGEDNATAEGMFIYEGLPLGMCACVSYHNMTTGKRLLHIFLLSPFEKAWSQVFI
jgi:hypothetical protein